MSKFVLISDLHWGCRNDLQIFYNYFEKFYDDLFSYMNENEIKTIFVLGDLFDRRKFINFKTLNAAKRMLFDRLLENNIDVHILIGNHDMHFREDTSISSPNLVLKEYENVKVYDRPNIVMIDSTSITMVPWICKENEKEIMEFMNQNNTDLCFGHFELAHFPMYKGIDSPHGMELNMLDKYELVCTGHYHTRSRRDNIVYIGCPYEMNWQDYGDTKGFHVFDTQTRNIEFVPNKHRIFYKIDYIENIELNYDVKDCFVRIIVTNKGDLYKFDQFINGLYSKGCYDIKIVEDLSDISDGEIGEDINLEDTLDVLCNYIDSLNLPNNDKLKQFMNTLYIEAVNLEVV